MQNIEIYKFATICYQPWSTNRFVFRQSTPKIINETLKKKTKSTETEEKNSGKKSNVLVSSKTHVTYEQ